MIHFLLRKIYQKDNTIGVEFFTRIGYSINTQIGYLYINLITCPYLEELSKINIDFLPENPATYSIEQTPSEPIIRKYLDGTTDRQVTFVFACRMLYSNELVNNINNSGFFEKFQDWLFDNSEEGILPKLEEGLTPDRIEAISSGYLYDISGDLSNARYQIQCRLLYEKEGK